MLTPGWCPPGYIPISQIFDQLVAWRREGVTFANIPDGKAAADVFGRLNQALAWGEIESAGVCVRSGDFLPIPPPAWRLDIPWRMGTCSQLDRALADHTVTLDLYLGPDVRAVLALKALAVWTGATITIEPPSIEPTEPRPKTMRSAVAVPGKGGTPPELELPQAGSKRLSQPPIPHGQLLRWWRDEYLKKHPDPDKRPTVDQQHADAKARFPDHAPPTTGQMQELRAHPDTPSEWREAGRRPKSS